MPWKPTPNKLCEMRVEIDGIEHWIAVEPQSYPVAAEVMRAEESRRRFDLGRLDCPVVAHPERAESLTLVRTTPGAAWSAIWVRTSNLREPVLGEEVVRG